MGEVLRTGDVFVPGRNPRFTYNPRTDRDLETRLRQYLEDGGAILALVGPTKTGKTVLLREVIEDPVWIESQGIANADQFWSLVGDELGVFVDVGEEGTSSFEGSAEVEANALFAKGTGGWAFGTSDKATRGAVRVPAAAARKALQQSQRVLVVDDFHFIDSGVQREIIRAIKPLVFNDQRVVFAAITHRVHDVPMMVEDMAGRTDPLRIELWKPDELLVIAEKGFAKLGVVDKGANLANELAANSFGSPHIMQKLCRELVRAVNNVPHTVSPTQLLRAPSDWQVFFASQVEEYAGQWFTRLINGPKKRTDRTIYELADGRKVDGYGLVLMAIATSGPKVTLRRDEILATVDALVDGGRKPEGHQITRFLKHMTRIAAQNLEEEVLPEDVLDADDGAVYTYAGVEPVLEYVDDGAASVLNIADPHFAFYMKWATDGHVSRHISV